MTRTCDDASMRRRPTRRLLWLIASQSDDITLCRDVRMSLLAHSAPACFRCMSLRSQRMRHDPRKRHSWVIDSGASVHWVSDPTSISYKHPPVLIKVADNRTLHAYAVGTAILPLLDQHHKTHHPHFITSSTILTFTQTYLVSAAYGSIIT